MRLLFLGLVLGLAAGLILGDRFGAPGFLRDAAGRFLGPPDEAPATEAESPAVQAADAVENDDLTVNQAGLEIIKDSEGLRLEAYRAGGKWLIGYGHTRTARQGMTITAAEAERLLREDVAASEEAVRRQVVVRANRNQFSALVSLAYNLGSGGFSGTSVLSRLNSGDYAGAADAFLAYDRARVDGEMRTIPHLTERRNKERALFLS
jgi:lysozyme